MDKVRTFNKIYEYKNPSLPIIIKTILQDVDILTITGEEKKTMSIELITECINTLPSSDYKIALLSSIDSGVISDMIDMIILASKKKLQLNKKTLSKMLISYLKCCVSILSKKQ